MLMGARPADRGARVVRPYAQRSRGVPERPKGTRLWDMSQPYSQVREDPITEAPRRAASVGDLVSTVKNDVLALIQNEIALAKAEMIPQAKSGGIGAVFFLGAGYFALNGLSLLFLSGAIALGQLFNEDTGGLALGFVIMAVIVFVIAGILAGIGLLFINKVKGPRRTKAQALASVETIRDAVTRATADVKTSDLERKTFRYPDLPNPAERR